MQELWVPAFGYEGVYEVSNLGRVKRVKQGPHTRPGFILKPSIGRKGYIRYGLRDGGPMKSIQAHRLVWQSFVERIPAGFQINHINGITDDNRLENLEVVTPSENNLHAFRVLGRKPNVWDRAGEKNGRAKLTEPDIFKIHQLRSEGLTQQKIADVYGVTQVQISSILRGESWPHVKSQI